MNLLMIVVLILYFISFISIILEQNLLFYIAIISYVCAIIAVIITAIRSNKNK